MKNRYLFKKAVMIFSAAAVFFGTGVFGTAVTAWADPGDGTIISDGINVRASAVDGDAIDTLSAGKEVTIVDSTTGSDGLVWYQIEYTSSGQTFSGWVRSDLVEAEDAETEAEAAEAEAQQAAEDAAEAAEEAQVAEEEAEAAEAAQSTETKQEVTLAVANSIPADVVPDGFQQTTVSYEGKDVPALVMNNAEVYLLYMEDTSHQTDGRLVVYDISKSELIPYINFPTDDGFILLLNIPDAELSVVSDRFAKTVCEFESGTMDALQMTQKDSIIAESANLEDFYYMYGVNRDGSYGWYTYNAPEGTIEESILSMHYNLNGTTMDVEEESNTFSLDSLSVVVIVGIIVIFLLLLILAIIFGVRYRQLSKSLDQKANRKEERKAQRDVLDSGTDSYADPTESLQTARTGQQAAPTQQATAQQAAPTQQATAQQTAATQQTTAQKPVTPTPQPTQTPVQKQEETIKGTPDPDDDDLEFL